MYLEFAGLPGSGKTTLSSALKEILTPRARHIMLREEAVAACIGRNIKNPFIKLFKKIPHRLWRPKPGLPYLFSDFMEFSSDNLEFVAFLSRLLADSSLDECLKKSIWRTFIRSFSEVGLISSCLENTESALMDEAFFQRCFTLLAYMDIELSDQLITRYANLAPFSKHIIWVDTSPEDSIKRLKHRYGKKPSPYAPYSEELLAEFTRGREIFHRLSNTLSQRGHTIYHINGNTDKAEVIKQVTKVASIITL